MNPEIGHSSTNQSGFSKVEQEIDTYRLTKRQIEVLQQIADGRTTEEIAEGMGLSPETIKSHVKGIVKAMGAVNRANAAAEGVRKGIIL